MQRRSSMSARAGRIATRAFALAWLAALPWSAAMSTVPGIDAKTAYSADQSDLWWNPAEPGWGMQIVQQADVLFATLFVYDAAGQPTFVTATLSPSGTLAWSGDLYRSTGPYSGAAFDPGAVAYRKVGTLNFSRTSAALALAQYSVDGVAVSKNVQRQLLRYENMSGSYVAVVNMSAQSCPQPSDNGQSTQQFTITITQDRTLMTLRWRQPDGTTCEFGGSYGQQGHVGQLEATYTCSTTERGNMSFFEMTNGVGMITGRFQGHSDNTGCDRRGQFTGLVPF